MRDSILAAPMGRKEVAPDRPYDLEFVRAKLFDETDCPRLPWMNDDARAAVNLLASEDLRDEIAEILGIGLSAAWTEVNYWRWPTGSYVGAHLDRYPRIVTHVLYLNDEWAEERGGNLEILNEPNQDRCSISIAPQFGRSMLIMASEDSWHRVARINGLGPPRLTVSTAYAIGTDDDIKALGHARHI